MRFLLPNRAPSPWLQVKQGQKSYARRFWKLIETFVRLIGTFWKLIETFGRLMSVL